MFQSGKKYAGSSATTATKIKIRLFRLRGSSKKVVSLTRKFLTVMAFPQFLRREDEGQHPHPLALNRAISASLTSNLASPGEAPNRNSCSSTERLPACPQRNR